VADVLDFFLCPEDEVALFRNLEPLRLSIYPELPLPGEDPIPLDGHAPAKLTASSYYLAAEHLGPIEVYTIKRGPNRGRLGIDEVRSPVIHYERSLESDGELRAGRVWAELVVSGNVQSNVGKVDAFRSLFGKVRDQLKKLRRSQPVGAFVGPQAARLAKGGLVLRGAGRHGKIYKPFR